MASHAFSTRPPSASVFLTAFFRMRGLPQASGGRRLEDALLVKARFARGGYEARPGLVRQRDAFRQALPACAHLGLAGHENFATSLDWPRALEKGNVVPHVVREEVVRIELLRVYVERQHSV